MKLKPDELLNKCKAASDKEVLKIMLTNPVFVDDIVLFILCMPDSLAITHKKYLSMMKQLAFKSRNTLLIQLIVEQEKKEINI
ncbi:hypothetical protein [Rummeliibacillus pycnus]|uniref:hypothetical protein n=1 Tax=Rummeliibacillus pycnus TaxID=101070 RepID=UPI000C99E10A|nr:hypothetical protein [Rummeliibacillus pycnus]